LILLMPRISREVGVSTDVAPNVDGGSEDSKLKLDSSIESSEASVGTGGMKELGVLAEVCSTLLSKSEGVDDKETAGEGDGEGDGDGDSGGGDKDIGKGGNEGAADGGEGVRDGGGAADGGEGAGGEGGRDGGEATDGGEGAGGDGEDADRANGEGEGDGEGEGTGKVTGA